MAEQKAKEPKKAEVNEPKKAEAKAEVKKFSKKQFVTSHKFAKRKDLLNALLKEDKKYSIKEVEDIINDFLYGKK